MLSALVVRTFKTSHSLSTPNHTRKIVTTMTTKRFDAVIIGSGQGGTPLATAFAQSGLKTALIERAHIGGCCVNEGCKILSPLPPTLSPQTNANDKVHQQRR